ncbi:hypothetical protein SAMN02745223_00034 [Devosia limi DSM 17137]|uniref:Uncharacterized protein n=1 Tax=Devosia limi DSM 17137 TaxID=1121477 RepID=A0A1M4SG94_9HYPH|nr:hypothetical protein SAMN02745223_00034 [Devosia limi DSM 17137]
MGARIAMKRLAKGNYHAEVSRYWRVWLDHRDYPGERRVPAT